MDKIAKAPDLEVPNFSDFESKEVYREYCAPRRGNPLPPNVLNTGMDLSEVNLIQESKRFFGFYGPY